MTSNPYRVILSNRAVKDLDRVHKYISRYSEQNAAEFVNEILRAIEHLDVFPHRTVVEQQSEKLRHPVRSLPVKSYVVFFRVEEQRHCVRVLRVRHGARRPLKRY